MNRKHDAVYEGLGADLDAEAGQGARGRARFLKRSTALAERTGGALEEKTLRWVDPADCVMWERHNRAYDLLSEANCRDLIDGIRAQGRQEFPAVVRRRDGGGAPFEVICGARRHFAVSWLRAHGYTQFRYLVDVRELTDEEAFRLSDVENRDRADISDFERARDYAQAIDAYYGGSQKAMAERLEVTEGWLSRYLALARLPETVVSAYADPRDLREAHARRLTPLMRATQSRGEVMAEARAIAQEQEARRAGQGTPIDGAAVTARLAAAVAPSPKRRPQATIYRRDPAESGLRVTRRGRTLRLELSGDASRSAVEAWLRSFLDAEFAGR